jgi:hypothetical protein
METPFWSAPVKSPPKTDNAHHSNRTQSTFTSQTETYVLQTDDDMISMKSFRTENTFSTTDGIDILGNPLPETFVDLQTSRIGKLISSRLFKRSIIVLLLLNAMVMGIATFDFVTENQQMQIAFDILDDAFLAFFTFEIGLRILHLGQTSLGDSWLVFDFSIIAASWFCGALLAIRTFRVLRTLRLATKFKPLRDVVLAIGRVGGRIVSIVVLFLLSLYIYSIIFTDLFKSTQDEFRRLDVTFWSLIQIMTLDGWSDIANESMQSKSWVWIVYVMFVLTTLVLMSLLVAVLVQALINPDSELLEHKKVLTPEPSPKFQESAYIARLEGKIDSLTQAVESLTKNQVKLQDDLTRSATKSVQSDGGFDEYSTYIVY